ncbi:hypothetical protein CBR_g29992 [Chara braunii]|uniref:Uncharacterized protein n=1 Tax=Chara braunii TaxID=69332 RepID=A0A388LBP6_CHABU|nr:hypothetical protein CBR_g29992 [Chara braunii]|eukprot:GBG79728.1 hypothetical protein CBR_g29992 [Chara braunii]
MRSSWSIELLHNEGYTHVITLDSAITDSPLLQNIINAGLNHIPCMALDVDEAITEFGNFLDELFARVMKLHDLTDSTKSFLRRIIMKKGKEKMEKYQATHRHVAVEPFEHLVVKRELAFLTSRFLIYPTDKAPIMSAFVCKNFIHKLAFQRLYGPEFASILAPPAAVLSRIRGELSALSELPAATAALPYLMEYIDDLGTVNNAVMKTFLSKREGRQAVDPCWIYPDEFIEIKENTKVDGDGLGRVANFLSMTIMVTSPLNGSYSTTRHDRRIGLGFAPCRFI